MIGNSRTIWSVEVNTVKRGGSAGIKNGDLVALASVNGLGSRGGDLVGAPLDVPVAELPIAKLKERPLGVALRDGAKHFGENPFPWGESEHHAIG